MRPLMRSAEPVSGVGAAPTIESIVLIWPRTGHGRLVST